MELLLSNFQPAKYAQQSFRSYFEKNLGESDSVKIASGFISTASLTELKRIIEENKRPRIELLIGMHYFEGFTRTQYEAANSLSTFLKDSSLGSVYLSTNTKFHGKMYSFAKAGKPYSAVIGSSNLSSLFDISERLYETDLLINEKGIVTEIDSFITKLFGSISEDFLTVKIDPNSFREFNPLLQNHEHVEETDQNIYQNALKQSTVTFEIPLSAQPKSNLNIFFGKGRGNQRGYFLPRHWYEAELIVPNSITSKRGYPRDRHFAVITDDGWTFKCYTGGTNAKNLRSEHDLKILGKWIKGRLEQSGALKVGEPVTEVVLQKYGRDTFSLIGTNDPNVWLLNFKV